MISLKNRNEEMNNAIIRTKNLSTMLNYLNTSVLLISQITGGSEEQFYLLEKSK